ncbi:atp binding protein [Anopheles sinensis]|uniref:Atp binding protein n=1 Tax=Anopheles sinensis TaxID=74873 RepID=A0A084VP24_ANOSI|nr:atp binding protein [Anopheles sinensis]
MAPFTGHSGTIPVRFQILFDQINFYVEPEQNPEPEKRKQRTTTSARAGCRCVPALSIMAFRDIYEPERRTVGECDPGSNHSLAPLSPILPLPRTESTRFPGSFQGFQVALRTYGRTDGRAATVWKFKAATLDHQQSYPFSEQLPRLGNSRRLTKQP